MNKKFLGSTIVLILGVLGFLGGIASVSKGDHKGDGLLAGILMIIGALTYKSAKKRKLGIVRDTKTRVAFEVIALIILIALVLLQNNLIYRIETDPVPNVLVPVGALIAYTVISLKGRVNK